MARKGVPHKFSQTWWILAALAATPRPARVAEVTQSLRDIGAPQRLYQLASNVHLYLTNAQRGGYVVKSTVASDNWRGYESRWDLPVAQLPM